jgi:hypothetical protein
MLLKHFMIICIFVTGVRGMMMMRRRMTMKFRRNQRSREEHLKNTLNRPNPVETGFEKERGWNPLGITKQEERESPRSPWSCPWSPIGEEWRGRISPRRSYSRSKGLNTQGTRLVR